MQFRRSLSLHYKSEQAESLSGRPPGAMRRDAAMAWSAGWPQTPMECAASESSGRGGVPMRQFFLDEERS